MRIDLYPMIWSAIFTINHWLIDLITDLPVDDLRRSRVIVGTRRLRENCPVGYAEIVPESADSNVRVFQVLHEQTHRKK